MGSERVGFVGAGRMGLPMVERLAAAGHELVVYARRAESAASLERLGVRPTSELAEAAADADVLLLCVFSDEQLTDIAGPLAAALPDGAVLASHVTGRASTLRSVAERFPAVHVVDAPVSGAPDDIRAGRQTVLLGGPPAARARAAGVVRAYGDPVIETGELGTALAVKLVNNLLFAANAQLAAEAVRLGEALGVTPGELLGALGHMSGGSEASRRAAMRADMAEFGARIGPFMSKDVAICLEQAAERGVDPGLLIEVVRRGRLTLTLCQPLTMRMASWTSRGSSGCIRAIDSLTGRPSFIARLSSRPVTPASLYRVSASNQPSSGTGRPSASSYARTISRPVGVPATVPGATAGCPASSVKKVSQARSMRGSPTDQISQSITALMRLPSHRVLPRRKSPWLTAGGSALGMLPRSALAARW